MHGTRIFDYALRLTAAGALAATLGPATAGAAAPSASGVAGIPAGSVVDSAIFSIYVIGETAATVNVHRITSPWTETGVTWTNFAASYDPAIIDSFVPDTIGWRSADVTDLVQNWVDALMPNYGVLLEQGNLPVTTYLSSEVVDVALRPMLEIYYTPPGGDPQLLVIQRPGADPDGVADAYIWALYPNENFNWERLYSGRAAGYTKQTLVRFDFDIDYEQPGTGTPGYWKNHPEAWPVEQITIGGIVYSKDEAIALMGTAEKGDKTYTMFRALVAAKLNVLIGNESDCIDDTISAADAWMAQYPVGSGVTAGGANSPWRVGGPLYEELDDYNNGYLCAPHRD